MLPEELRAIREYLSNQVTLGGAGADGQQTVEFRAPTAEEMVGKGLNPAGCQQVLTAPWWDEMVTDIVETPEMCDPNDSPEQVLQYAKDVVVEYLRKRAQL